MILRTESLLTRKILPAVIACALLTASAPALAQVAVTSGPLPNILDAVRPRSPDSFRVNLSQTSAQRALELLANMQLDQASKAMNEALQLDTGNAALHFFNGLIYHLQARQGDSDKLPLAIQGYQQAVRIEPAHWVAHEFHGLALLEIRRYGAAQAAFAEATLANPGDALISRRLMAASYMAGDAVAACALADQFSEAEQTADEKSARSFALVYAACGKLDKATTLQAVHQRIASSDHARAELPNRISQWHRILNSQGGLLKLLVQQGPPPPRDQSAADTPSYGQPTTPKSPTQSAPGDRMVLVDVVMVRSEDSTSTLRGVNLLSALSLQFGSPRDPAFSRTFSSTDGSAASTVLTRAITVPALQYSLNIANAKTNLNEVLARPTLAAVEGQRSEFFSGTNLNAAVISSGSTYGGSVTVEKRYGVKLTILPQILPNGMVKLAIEASRTFLKAPSADISYTYKLEISEIQANANVVMRVGDTLVLGGLSEKETSNVRDGVPFLQDIPVVQYLFSQQAKSEYQKSVLILITPRPASYTWLSEESRAAIAAEGDSPFSPSMDVFRARNADWFKPYPNLGSVFAQLNAAGVYREFRTGDVSLENWDRTDTTRDRLIQALKFLHY